MESVGTARPLTSTALAGLWTDLRGEVITPQDAGFDQARRIWNGAHDRRPAAVIRCAGVSDLMRTVGLARSEGLPLAVRAGGHSIPGFSTCDDGRVIDLSLMRGIRVDPVRQLVQVQTGCLWRDLDPETQQFNLAVTGGLVSSTGVAGFTLGGGIGWLTRRCGLTADNLIGADVVTADGQLVRAQDDADLLWALRGGGGNFGVVTTLDLRLHDVGPTVFAGVVYYPACEAERVLDAYATACRQAPDGLTTLLKLTTGPTGPAVPAELHGASVVAVGGCWAGDPAGASKVTRPFRSLGTVLADAFSHRHYVEWQQALDPQFPPGLHCYFRSAFLKEIGHRDISILLAGHELLPNRLTEIIVHQLGGAAGRVAPSATAFANRTDDFIVNVIARSDGPGEFPRVREFARALVQDLAPGAATYVNFSGEGDPVLVRSSYPPDTLGRLVQIKDRYDPSNLFHLNQNVVPSRLP